MFRYSSNTMVGFFAGTHICYRSNRYKTRVNQINNDPNAPINDRDFDQSFSELTDSLDLVTAEENSQFKQQVFGYDGCKQRGGEYFAYGTEEPADHLYEQLLERIKNSQGTIKLVLTAHSRGCLSALLLAKKINSNDELKKRVEITLDFRDPIPGNLNFSPRADVAGITTITKQLYDLSDCECIKKVYVTLQQMDVVGCNALISKFNPKTEVEVEYQPGGHVIQQFLANPKQDPTKPQQDSRGYKLYDEGKDHGELTKHPLIYLVGYLKSLQILVENEAYFDGYSVNNIKNILQAFLHAELAYANTKRNTAIQKRNQADATASKTEKAKLIAEADTLEAEAQKILEVVGKLNTKYNLLDEGEKQSLRTLRTNMGMDVENIEMIDHTNIFDSIKNINDFSSFLKDAQIDFYDCLAIELTQTRPLKSLKKIERKVHLIDEKFSVTNSDITKINCFNMRHASLQREQRERIKRGENVNRATLLPPIDNTYFPVPLLGAKLSDQPWNGKWKLNNASFIKIPDKPFQQAYERIMLILNEQVKTNLTITKDKIKYIDYIKRNLENIAKKNVSDTDKLLRMERYLLEVYWIVRTNEGLFKSKLRTSIEWFMNSSELLGIKDRYGLIFPETPENDIHSVRRLYNATMHLTGTHENGEWIVKGDIPKYAGTAERNPDLYHYGMKFLSQLRQMQHKTKRNKQVEILSNDIAKLLNPNNFNNQPTWDLRNFITKLTEMYSLIRKDENRFFSSILGDFIEKFLKNELKMTVPHRYNREKPNEFNEAIKTAIDNKVANLFQNKIMENTIGYGEDQTKLIST